VPSCFSGNLSFGSTSARNVGGCSLTVPRRELRRRERGRVRLRLAGLDEACMGNAKTLELDRVGTRLKHKFARSELAEVRHAAVQDVHHVRPPEASNRAAVFTVSPNRSYRGRSNPTMPDAHGPAFRPAHRRQSDAGTDGRRTTSIGFTLHSHCSGCLLSTAVIYTRGSVGCSVFFIKDRDVGC
jgi:hypothetical protein